MEFIKKPNISTQEKIKRDFLNDKITAEEFAEKWKELDQSGTHTEEATLNIKVFGDEAVQRKIATLGDNFKTKYNIDMAISYFHKAQAIKFERELRAPDFKKALEYYLKNSESKRYKATIQYIEGTVKYFEKDIETLEKIITELKKNPPSPLDVNTEILQRMLVSLKNGDDPEEAYVGVYSDHQ